MPVNHQIHTDKYSLYNGDSCEVLPEIPSESVGFCIYSPPFAELYNYSSSDRDLSNCRSYEEFLEHYRFIVEQVYRVLKPGRLTAIHCMDLKVNSHRSRDFPGDIIRLHESVGFEYPGFRHAIWKEPLRVAIRTRSLHLMHRQIVKDSTLCGAAGADYLVIMRKPGENKEPVSHPKGLMTYAGENQPPAELVLKYAGWEDPSTNKHSHYIWQRYASSFWDDIRAGRVLPYKPAREKDDEKHVCPLQLDVIERGLTLYSNPGDVVLTPFLGVGSEIFAAVQNGRKGIGIELKETYYKQACRNIEHAAQNEKYSDEDLFSFAAKKKNAEMSAIEINDDDEEIPELME
jgi:DNA modification methylase